jgi:hypothetical protein
MTGAHPLLLDHAVRDWVFIPLTLAIVLMKLLTQYMHQVRLFLACKRRALLSRFRSTCARCTEFALCQGISDRKHNFNVISERDIRGYCARPQLFNTPPPNNKELKEVREMQAVARSGRLRGFGRFIPETSFKMRKEYFAGVCTACAPGSRGSLGMYLSAGWCGKGPHQNTTAPWYYCPPRRGGTLDLMHPARWRWSCFSFVHTSLFRSVDPCILPQSIAGEGCLLAETRDQVATGAVGRPGFS